MYGYMYREDEREVGDRGTKYTSDSVSHRVPPVHSASTRNPIGLQTARYDMATWSFLEIDIGTTLGLLVPMTLF